LGASKEAGDPHSQDVLRYQCILEWLKCDCGAQQQIALSENGARIRPMSTGGRENSVISDRIVKSGATRSPSMKTARNLKTLRSWQRASMRGPAVAKLRA
jgi:hypothetical protein